MTLEQARTTCPSCHSAVARAIRIHPDGTDELTVRHTARFYSCTAPKMAQGERRSPAEKDPHERGFFGAVQLYIQYGCDTSAAGPGFPFRPEDARDALSAKKPGWNGGESLIAHLSQDLGFERYDRWDVNDTPSPAKSRNSLRYFVGDGVYPYIQDKGFDKNPRASRPIAEASGAVAAPVIDRGFP